MEYLPIEKKDTKKNPFKFKITILQETYTFVVYYNQEGDYFSFNIYDINNEVIVKSRKIVVGMDMMKNITDTFDIIPLSLSESALKKGITFNNFMEDIKPYIFEGGFEWV